MRASVWVFAGAAVVAAAVLSTGPSRALHLAVSQAEVEVPYGAADILLPVLAGGFLLAAWGLRRMDVDRVLFVLIVGTSSVAAYLTNEVLKRLFAWQRPCVEFLVDPRCPGPDSWSFPSNHTAIAFALATAMALVALTRWACCGFVIATLAAVSRVVDGVHYPHDVVAGAAVGMCMTIGFALVLGWAIQRFRPPACRKRQGDRRTSAPVGESRRPR